MAFVVGDVWQLANELDTIVIPTNEGWKRNGQNVMGRGLAAQAAKRWPNLPAIYGEFCQKNLGERSLFWVHLPKNKKGKTTYRRWCDSLILFAVKPLDEKQPHLTWMRPASLEKIEKGLIELEAFVHTPEFTQRPEAEKRHIYVPYLGCGNGGLATKDVEPLLTRYLTHSAFIVVCQHESALQNAFQSHSRTSESEASPKL